MKGFGCTRFEPGTTEGTKNGEIQKGERDRKKGMVASSKVAVARAILRHGRFAELKNNPDCLGSTRKGGGGGSS